MANSKAKSIIRDVISARPELRFEYANASDKYLFVEWNILDPQNIDASDELVEYAELRLGAA
jgi:hypothetical protein